MIFNCNVLNLFVISDPKKVLIVDPGANLTLGVWRKRRSQLFDELYFL